MKNLLFTLLIGLFSFSFFGCNLKCSKFYTYNSKKVDVTGISTSLKKAGVEFANIGVAAIVIEPKYVTATEKMQELDLLQNSLCGQIRGLPRKSALRKKLTEQYTTVLLDMIKIAQHPESTKP